MTALRSKTWALALIVPAAFALLWHLQQKIDARLSAMHQESDEVVLNSPKIVKAMSLEYAPLVADIYWTRAVQYYGGKRVRNESNIGMLWPLLDLATTLDPQLIPAYRFGAIFLSEPAPRGAGRPDLAVKLLQRGIKANPDFWRFYQDLGFVYYWELKDYKKAADAFYEGSRNPNALIFMKVLAARIAAEGASPETSFALWQQILGSTKDPEVIKNAESHLRLLRVEMDCNRLDQIADEYRKRVRRRPSTMKELVEAGMLRGVPLDPRGYPYDFGANGKAEVNLNSPMLDEQLANRPLPQSPSH